MRLLQFSALPLLLPLVLCACDGSRSSAARATTEAASVANSAAPAGDTQAPSGQAIRGRIAGAPAGTEVHLVRPGAAPDLIALAESLVDTTEVDANGDFALEPAGEAPGEGWLLTVSAPGCSLVTQPLGQRVELQPEARVEVLVKDTAGHPVDLAFGMVLDAQGRPLPLPVAELVSAEDGRLVATRLPAGALELLVASPSLQRTARVTLQVAAGETRSVEVTLDHDDDLTRRLLVIAGGPEVAEAIGAGGAK